MQSVESGEARNKPVGIDRDKIVCRLHSVYGDAIIGIVSHASMQTAFLMFHSLHGVPLVAVRPLGRRCC